jgi:hypothetical protein
MIEQRKNTGLEREKRDHPFSKERALVVGDAKYSWRETTDFPLADPWSEHTRNVIELIGHEGGFRGNLFEAGVGDGRNIVTARAHEYLRTNRGSVIGVDLDSRRLALARQNVLPLLPEGQLQLYHGDVVQFLHQLPADERLTGWGIACLPQAPLQETVNCADGFDSHLASLQEVLPMRLDGGTVDSYGLTLNAAFLKALSEKVDKKDFTLLLTISGRVPSTVRKELYDKTGWSFQDEYPRREPVQQDPDTGIAYVRSFDRGISFTERTMNGRYHPITALEAEKRRVASIQNRGRESLNVYHDLYVARLVPQKIIYEA